MSDFLTRLAARSLDQTPAVRPRLASLYEPSSTADKMMAGVVFDRPDSDWEEFDDASLSDSPSLFRRAQPVPTTPPGTAAQPPRTAQAHQSNEAATTIQTSHRPEEIFRGTESAPDKPGPREIGAEPLRQPWPTDFSTLQKPSSDPVIPAAMIHSPDQGPRPDLAPTLSSKSTNDKPEPSVEYDAHNYPQSPLETSVDQRIEVPRAATGTTQPPVSPQQIVVSPSSGTEETNRTATDQMANPVTIERIVARELSPQVVSAQGVSRTRTSVQRTASADKAELHGQSSAVHPVTIERIAPASESPQEFVSAEDVSLTATSFQETASAEEAKLRFAGPAVHPITIERIIPASELMPPQSFRAKASSSAEELSPSRTMVPTPPATIAVQPQKISRVRSETEAPADSPAPEPNVQVTIGRIEVRAIKAAEVPPKSERAARSTLMSLDDYLRQRAQGGKR